MKLNFQSGTVKASIELRGGDNLSPNSVDRLTSIVSGFLVLTETIIEAANDFGNQTETILGVYLDTLAQGLHQTTQIINELVNDSESLRKYLNTRGGRLN